MNTRSIRFHLVIWYAGLLIVVFVLLGLLMYTGVKVHLERSLGETQIRRARQIAESLIARVDQTGEGYVRDEINSRFDPEINDRFIRVTRADDSVLYVSGNPKDLSFDAAHLPVLVNHALGESWRKAKLSTGRELLIAAMDYHAPGGKSFQVEVGESLEPIQAVLRRLLLLLAAGLTVMVIVSASGGYFLVRKALAPVDRIASSAEHITLHNLRERLPIAQTGDELQRLSVSLNHMIERLEDAFLHNRRFLADASHELRTPLTIMRGELESIVEKTGRTPEVQATAASILEEVERLARIVEGLFAISRLEAGEAQKESVLFDLAELTAGTSDQMGLLAEDKGIAVSCSTPGQVLVRGDRARMKQVVVNLLDNAIKYTPAGGAVKLSVAAVNGKAVLEVADNGIGIPPEARPHLFERFFRVDKARSREMGGAGLGLSIVKSICAAHGGIVDYQSAEGSGSRFKVELPLAQSNNGKPETKNGNQ